MLTREEREFAVSLYGDTTKYNDVLSKVRCRIFYKGANRNGTYITDEFAEQLIASLPYTPMKGIFENGAFQGHGEENAEGKIYGIVPENANFAWEAHLDEDGVEREYACCDVLVFSELYAEANAIVGKGQSMELFPKTLKWHREVRDGQAVIVFDSGCFFGLQVLGDSYEPCFEGAAFFSLRDSIEKAMFELEKIYELENNKMVVNFNNPSYNERAQALNCLLNPNFCEEGGWVMEYSIMDVWDEFCLCYKYETNEYYRAYYTVSEDGAIAISSMELRHYVDLSENEFDVVEKLRAINGGNYELVSDEVAAAHDNAEKVVEFEQKIVELETANSTYQLEKENFEGQIAELSNTISGLNEVQTGLNEKVSEYEKAIEAYEDEHKEAVIAQYENLLDADTLEDYRARKGEFESAVALDKEMAYQLKSTNISVYSATPKPQYMPKDDIPVSGIEAILSKYPKN